MTRESIIQHNPKSAFVAVRQDYLALIDHMSIGSCPDKFCTAAILNVFEYWTNYKYDEAKQKALENEIRSQGNLKPLPQNGLWIYKTQDQLKQDDLMDMWGLNKVSKCLDWLELAKLLETRQNPNYGWDRTKQYLLNVELINTSLKSIKSTIFNSKESNPQNQRMESLELKNASFNSKGAIPKSTSKKTNKETLLSPTGDDPQFLVARTGTIHSNRKGSPLCGASSKKGFTSTLEGDVTCKSCLKKMGRVESKRDPVIDWVAQHLLGANELEAFKGWSFASQLKKQIVKVHQSYPGASEPTTDHLDLFKNWYLNEKYKNKNWSLPRKEETVYIEYNTFFGEMRKRGSKGATVVAYRNAPPQDDSDFVLPVPVQKHKVGT